MGIRTITLASRMVRTACHQFMPPSISEEAIMYVGMQAASEIHRTAMSFSPQRRSLGDVGAMSALQYGEEMMCRSSETSGMTRSCSSLVTFPLTPNPTPARGEGRKLASGIALHRVAQRFAEPLQYP